jgi:hypothetical protein
MRAFVCFVVVVVVVVVGAVVVQPTIAAIHTPKTSGINFFMMLVLPERSSNHNPLPHAFASGRTGRGGSLAGHAVVRPLPDEGGSLTYGRNSEALMSSILVHPHNNIASSSSRRTISNTCAAPCSPFTANPHKIGRPTNTARAPSAIAFSTSLPRRIRVVHVNLATIPGRLDDERQYFASCRRRIELAREAECSAFSLRNTRCEIFLRSEPLRSGEN